MEFDVIVIGGGPSGATAAMYMAKALGKEKVLLVDKTDFPRDKICGDAQGRKAFNIMKELGIEQEYRELEGQPIYGITLSSPNGTQVHVDVAPRDEPPPGYVHKRMIFDDFLFQNAKKRTTFKQLQVTDLIMDGHTVKGIKGTTKDGKTEEYHAKIVLACDGATSTVAAKFGLNTNPPDHFIVATRQYWKGVKGMSDRIEIHMIKSLIPGYFWIFPLPNGEANIGLGMIIKDMKSKNVNLKEAMLHEIKHNPLFAKRFEGAEPLEDVRAWNLPIASYHRKCYSNGLLILGDAASLIDPLSGEGVGNAMISSKIGAFIALEAIKLHDVSEKFLKKYDELLWEAIGPEVKANYRLQKLGKRFPFMIDRLIVKASKDEEFRQRMEKMLPYTGGRQEIGTVDFLSELAPDEKDVIAAAKEEE